VAKKTAITLDYIKKNYPGYRLVRVHEYKRKNKLPWVRAIGYTELWRFDTVEAQIKAVIETGAEKICILLRDPVTDQVLIPDIDVQKFTKFE